MLKLKVKKLDPTAKLPTRSYYSSIGYDLYALESIFIEVGQTAKISTGIAVDLPLNHILEIKDRSSMAIKGLRTGAGVIDPTYNGDLSVVIHNLNYNKEYNYKAAAGFWVSKGDKIAQFVITKVETPELVEDDNFEYIERGELGFGSSGK